MKVSIRKPYQSEILRNIPLEVFAMLSGLSGTEVQSHFRRKLTGRINGRAAVIINEEKEFSLIYKVNLNQCIIEFYYGVWNSARFPLHH